MNDTTIECLGLPCPQPVLRCKERIEQDAPERISVLVDNPAAKENVSRYLGTQGYDAVSEDSDGNYLIIGTKQAHCPECELMSEQELTQAGAQKNLVFLGSDTMGEGDDELGSKLMYNFLLTLKEMGSDLWRVVMVNGGVKLATSGNPCLEPLLDLEKDGVSILVCGTCLEHFDLLDAKQVGDVTNMLDIVTSFQLATKTIRV